MDTTVSVRMTAIRIIEKLLSREFLIIMLASVALIMKLIDAGTYQMMLVCGIGALTGKKYIDKQNALR